MTAHRSDGHVPWYAETGVAGGPLVVLVHGTMDRAAGMLQLARHLEDRVGARYCILRFDRRGYGRSPHAGPFGMAHQVDDLMTLLDGRRAVVFGHSYGGNVALAAATRHPASVAGVGVYESPMSWEPWWPSNGAASRALAEVADPAAAAEAFMRRLVGSSRWESLPERTRQTRLAEGPTMLGELGDLRASRPWRADDITMPLVTGCGELARPHHRRGMSELAAAVPGALFVDVPGCGHDAPTAAPGALVEQMLLPLLERCSW
ncbi:MAG: alpha/beta fold hydrolase [Ilumatobacteraceae bacterium]